MGKPATVDAYLASAAAEQRAALESLRAMIRKALPHAIESIGSSGFPVYTDEHGTWLAGFATRKKGPMLYIMNAGLLDRYAKELAELRSGKSCIDWRPTERLPEPKLTRLAEELLQKVNA